MLQLGEINVTIKFVKKMTKITRRQNLIMDFIRKKGEVGNKEIREHLQWEIGQ